MFSVLPVSFSALAEYALEPALRELFLSAVSWIEFNPLKKSDRSFTFSFSFSSLSVMSSKHELIVYGGESV